MKYNKRKIFSERNAGKNTFKRARIKCPDQFGRGKA
jgi:hypothetical protein